MLLTTLFDEWQAHNADELRQHIRMNQIGRLEAEIARAEQEKSFEERKIGATSITRQIDYFGK